MTTQDEAVIDVKTGTSNLKTFQFTITMPLIPSYKTEVAKYCRDPENGITGGFIRWQSMNTIYGIKYALFDVACSNASCGAMFVPVLCQIGLPMSRRNSAAVGHA